MAGSCRSCGGTKRIEKRTDGSKRPHRILGVSASGGFFQACNESNGGCMHCMPCPDCTQAKTTVKCEVCHGMGAVAEKGVEVVSQCKPCGGTGLRQTLDTYRIQRCTHGLAMDDCLPCKIFKRQAEAQAAQARTVVSRVKVQELKPQPEIVTGWEDADRRDLLKLINERKG